MAKCDMDCFNCIYPDCINDYVKPQQTWNEIKVKHRQRNKENCKRRYDHLKKNGLCVDCGKRKATNGIFCLDCYAKRKRNRKYATIPKWIEWQEKGLCRFCGGESVQGKRVCEKHYKMMLEIAKKKKGR